MAVNFTTNFAKSYHDLFHSTFPIFYQLNLTTYYNRGCINPLQLVADNVFHNTSQHYRTYTYADLLYRCGKFEYNIGNSTVSNMTFEKIVNYIQPACLYSSARYYTAAEFLIRSCYDGCFTKISGACGDLSLILPSATGYMTGCSDLSPRDRKPDGSFFRFKRSYWDIEPTIPPTETTPPSIGTTTNGEVVYHEDIKITQTISHDWRLPDSEAIPLDLEGIPLYRKAGLHNIADSLERDLESRGALHLLPKTRPRRWSANAVCNWPVVSAAAKIAGGECSVTPNIDDLRNTLTSVRDILAEHDTEFKEHMHLITLSNQKSQVHYEELKKLTAINTAYINTLKTFLETATTKLKCLDFLNQLQILLYTVDHYANQFYHHYNGLLTGINFSRLTDYTIADLKIPRVLTQLLLDRGLVINAQSNVNYIFHRASFIDFGLPDIYDFSIEVLIPIARKSSIADYNKYTLVNVRPIGYRTSNGSCYLTPYRGLAICNVGSHLCYSSEYLGTCRQQSGSRDYFCNSNLFNSIPKITMNRFLEVNCDILVPEFIEPDSIYLPFDSTICVSDCSTLSYTNCSHFVAGTTFIFACGKRYQINNIFNATEYHYNLCDKHCPGSVSNVAVLPFASELLPYGVTAADNTISISLDSYQAIPALINNTIMSYITNRFSIINNPLQQLSFEINRNITNVTTTTNKIVERIDSDISTSYNKINNTVTQVDRITRVLQTQISNLTGYINTFPNWLQWVHIAVTAILTTIVLFGFSLRQYSPSMYSTLLLSFIMLAAAADAKSFGNCTDISDSRVCHQLHYDACYQLANDTATSLPYCYCESTDKYVSPDDFDECYSPNWFFRMFQHVYRFIFDPYWGGFILVFFVIIIFLLFISLQRKINCIYNTVVPQKSSGKTTLPIYRNYIKNR